MKCNNLSNIAIILCSLLFCQFTIAQSTNWAFTENLKEAAGKYNIELPEKVVGVIIYQQIYAPDSMHIDSLLTDTMSLSFSQHYSDYRNEKRREFDSIASEILILKSKEQPNSENNDPFPSYDFRLPKTRFLTKNNMVFEYRTLIDNLYLIKYITKAISWKIADSTKKVCGFLCQKADAEVLGRHYTAWFTTDLPNTFGPRTLVGLPGIILQAYDDSKQIIYNAIKVFYKNDKDLTIGFPKNGISCNYKDFDNLLTVLETNPKAFMQVQKNIVIGTAKPSKIGNTQLKKKIEKDNKNAIELKREEQNSN